MHLNDGTVMRAHWQVNDRFRSKPRQQACRDASKIPAAKPAKLGTARKQCRAHATRSFSRSPAPLGGPTRQSKGLRNGPPSGHLVVILSLGTGLASRSLAQDAATAGYDEPTSASPLRLEILEAAQPAPVSKQPQPRLPSRCTWPASGRAGRNACRTGRRR